MGYQLRPDFMRAIALHSPIKKVNMRGFVFC